MKQTWCHTLHRCQWWKTRLATNWFLVLSKHMEKQHSTKRQQLHSHYKSEDGYFMADIWRFQNNLIINNRGCASPAARRVWLSSHREILARCSSLKEFGFNANAIAIAGQLASIIKGNVVGWHHQGCRQPHAGVMAEPLNARKSSAMRRRFDNSQ